MIRPQDEFPLMEEYKQQGFTIDENTIFALGEDIYTNKELTPDLLVHEIQHLKQQQRDGTKEWLYDYLYVPKKRLEYEIDAYRAQLRSIKDRNHKNKIRLLSARTLSSSLYGNIITYEEALAKLKV